MRNETSAFYFRKAELDALANGVSLLNQQQRTATSNFLKQSYLKDQKFISVSEDELVSETWYTYSVLKTIEGPEAYEQALYNTIKGIEIQQLSPQNIEALTAIWSQISNFSPDKFFATDLAEFMEMTRCLDKGWSHVKKSRHSSIFGCWLAFSAYQNLEKAIPDELKILEILNKMRAKDGAFSHQSNSEHGSIPSTYFAISLLKAIEEDISHKTTHWISQQQADDGGFLAAHVMPFGDTQSTAQALMSLKITNWDLSSIKPACLNFLADHLHQNGGFISHCREPESNAQSTYYGLVALGLLDEYLPL